MRIRESVYFNTGLSNDIMVIDLKEFKEEKYKWK